MSRRYFIFRLVKDSGIGHRRLYLMENGLWTKVASKAFKGNLKQIKPLVDSLKGSFPHLIIELYLGEPRKDSAPAP